MGNSLNDVCDRLQEKFGLLDEAVKELKEALINAQESLGMSISYPPYRERLHPRKHWQRKPYWLRTRSNPKKKGYH